MGGKEKDELLDFGLVVFRILVSILVIKFVSLSILLYNKIESEECGMFETLSEREKFIEQFKKDLSSNFPSSDYQIWIFGSFLTEEYIPGKSDIDIGIFCDNVARLNDIYEWVGDYLDRLNLAHDLVMVELDNDNAYMNIPIMFYGKPIMEYFTNKFIDNLKHLISIWGTNPFDTILKRSRA